MVAETQSRAPLSRGRILQAAVAFVDEHGLESLSMHKLADRLGVKGMSLYNHVKGKDGLLDGIVEAIWSEVDLPADEPTSWQEEVRAFAGALRDTIRRHPNAAPLVTSRSIMPTQELAFFNTYLARLQAGGLGEPSALELVRTVSAYAIGFALFELTWMEGAKPAEQPDDGLRSFRHVSGIVPQNAPDHLVRTAMILCTRCDMDSQFAFGVDLMVRGLDGGPTTTP